MRALSISLLALLALPAAAHATSLRITNGALRYAVTSSAQSRMTLTQVPGDANRARPATTITSTAPCRSVGPNDATCPGLHGALDLHQR